MMWTNWNKADKTLVAAGAIFLFALCLNIEYRDNVWAAGLLFCAEAALVGGIADWFAVTALFEKPLGFPWHTAILPRRRQAFIEATGTMLQKEFFGKKALINKIKDIDFAALLAGWLSDREHRQKAAKWLGTRSADWLRSQSGLPSGQLRYPAELQLTAAGLRPLLLQGLRALQEMAGQPACKAKIQAQLESYADSKLKGSMAMMLAGFAQSVNLINLEEAAGLIQKRLIMLLESAQQEGTAEYEQLNAALEKILIFYEKNIIIKQELNNTLLNRLATLDFREYVSQSEAVQAESVELQLQCIGGELIQAAESFLSGSAVLQQEFNGLVYQFAARGILQAQELLGNIAGDVLGTMTDEQINRLVYDKAEPDLLWIRMNGSIVGAAIGLVIYVVMQVI